MQPNRGAKAMYFDPHIHMTSRTTDDYEKMADSGIVAVIEPAFWLGQPRTNSGSYKDYLSSLVGWEKFRASQFGIQHYCTIGLNSKEANNLHFANEVMDFLPIYAAKPSVLAIGEIGFDDQTKEEEHFFRAQLELAKELNLPVQIHTPHRDKKNGTLKSMAICLEHGLNPERVVIDHNNEETVQSVLEQGFWAAFTIYPRTKMGNKRMVEIVRQYGSQKIMVDSSADWGVSDPLAVPKTAKLMEESGIDAAHIHAVSYANAVAFFSQSGRLNERDWLNLIPENNQPQSFNGNTVTRGQESVREFSSDNIIE